MKLLRLRVANFAGVREADIEFGCGLNVLYGPNDLGKSTLVEAIRLALLLPHGSTSCDQYVAWTGARAPLVELTFETENQRVWRVRKEFGRGGSSLLQESKNGRDFDDVERARKVDGRMREILRWGIPEPGGSGGNKGIPTSFLATALLSTQSDVAAMLRESLQSDVTSSGKDQIAAALQAVAQDPLFIALLKSAQTRRDEAYTDKGAKKTAKGSVFKIAADRVRDTRDEKERLQRIVSESEGAERLLRELLEKRDEQRETVARVSESLAQLETMLAQSAERDAAAEDVRLAEDEVQRIRRLSKDIEDAKARATQLIQHEEVARQALLAAENLLEQAEIQLKEAEEAARHESADPVLNDTVLRQELELRKGGAEHAALLAQQNIDSIAQAQQAVDAAADAERDCLTQDKVVRTAKEASSAAEVQERASREQLLHCDVLERALDLRLAEKQLADAQGAVQKKEGIQASIDLISAEHARLVSQRTAMKLPQPAVLAPMRRLESDLATARGALDVGFVVKVNAIEHVDLQVQKDGHTIEPIPANGPLEIEAVREVDIRVSDIATIQVRGGRVDAQDRVRVLEDRWSVEVVPHLAAAAVSNLEGLQNKLDEAVELDAQIKDKNNELTSLQVQIGPLTQSAEVLEQATSHAVRCRQALGDASVESLASDLRSLGADPSQELRKRRLQASENVDGERTRAAEATKLTTIAHERAAHLRVAFNAAVEKRDRALQTFPEGLDAALSKAQQSLASAAAEKENAAAELTALEQTISSRKESIDTAVVAAKKQVEDANSAVTVKGQELKEALERRAEHAGRLSQLQRQWDSENPQAAELALLDATARHDSLPVPDRHVKTDELVSAKNDKTSATSQLEMYERELQRAHGALEQVGGAVARERLRDATDALELAERSERETEADYDAWKLLLEQMKEADSAQASNLGQSLAPPIANLFQTLTQRRYESIQLTAQLGTEGVVLGGMTRPTDRLSVGTREQLSTLYRLALAEYLRATVVLDDQLVQSDDSRMEWFRSLLNEKAGIFQIIVFTCRPNDYLATGSMVPDGSVVHVDTSNGLVRAIDLGRLFKQARSNP
jgi:AAA domain